MSALELRHIQPMDVNSTQPSPSAQEAVKRVACTRCRTQKLKCLKSAQASDSGSNSKRCDRCRKADAECNYAASRPVGRPKSHGRRSSRSPKSPPPPAPRRPSTTTTTTTDTQQPQPQLYLDDDYFNTLLLAAETPATTDAAMLDAHGFDLFYHDPVPSPGEHHHYHHHQSDSTSASIAADHQHRRDPLLTPPSSSSSFPPFPTASSAPSHTSSSISSSISSGIGSGNVLLPRPGAGAAVDRRRAMQHLSDLGLRLYTQLAKYQDGGPADNPDVGSLAGDVLRSSNDYLAAISLFSQYQRHQDRRGHLDMATAFQLLIPYVRLVQLHDMLLEVMLRRLSSSATTPATTRCESAGFPDVWVGGVCVVAAGSNGQGSQGGQGGGGVFGARLLLQMCLCALGEIESVLALPGEARIVCGGGGDWGPGGGGAGGDEEGAGYGGGGLLPQAVSPRLLRTMLDERGGGGGAGGVDVQATRDRIAGVRRLLRRSGPGA